MSKLYSVIDPHDSKQLDNLVIIFFESNARIRAMRPLLAKMQPLITVVTHISADVAQPSLLINTKDGKKYLLGRIGEGFQRSLHEHSVRSSKLSGVFLTGRLNWESISGVPGFLLSLGDRQVNLNRLYTGPGLPWTRAQKMIESWQKFTFHHPLTVEAVDQAFDDENVSIVPLTMGKDSTSYAVQMKPTRGKFDVSRAKELGIPPGKLFSQLSNGESVQIPGTDRIVHAHDVVGPSPTPSRILILDLPSMEHVRSALESNLTSQNVVLGRKRKDSERNDSDGIDYELRSVFYIFSESIDLHSEDVQNLVKLFSKSGTLQFVSHPATSPDFNTLSTMAEFQSIFRSEFPSHFPPLYSQPAREAFPSSLTAVGCRAFQQHYTLSLAPREVLRSKKVNMELLIPSSGKTDHTISSGHVPSSLENLIEPEVVTLGTGASAPSKHRNVSGTLVRSNAGAYIFDCGEATYNTLGRIYGPQGRIDRLSELRLLYISHMHADHHLGTLQLLKGWLEHVAKHDEHKTLAFVAPSKMLEFVKEWSDLDDFSGLLDKHVKMIDLESLCIGRRYSTPTRVTHSQLEQIWNSIGLQVLVCKAVHCMFSYSVSVTTLDGSFKVSYSGDTRPNAYFADKIGLGSDLLIHEATHENELAEEAEKKRHSTIGDALQIASQMRAKYTVLTHISQRYPQLPTIGEGGAKVGDGQYACFGFDTMHTGLSQIKDLQGTVPRMGELLKAIESENEGDSNSEAL